MRWPLGIAMVSGALVFVAGAGRQAHHVTIWLLLIVAVLVMVEGWRRGR